MSAKLDCIVVGYYEAPLAPMLEAAEGMQEFSGGYQHLKANTLLFRGERVRYPDLLNRCIETATGKPSNYHVGRMPNLGAFYLASFLRQRSLQAEVVNFFNHDQDRFRQLLAEGPNAVAITTTFYFDSQPVRDIVDFIRRYDDRTTIIVGGPYIYNVCSDYPPQAQDYIFSTMDADVYVCDSQGELTLSRVCTELRNSRPDLAAIPNLIYTDDHKTFSRTSRQVEDNDMNHDAVDWSHFDRDVLVPTVQTRTARSCAYKCAFCRYPVIAGELVFASLDTIERELNYLQSIGVTHLLFIDDTFNIPRSRFKDICRLMIRNQYDFKWFSYFRCANADDEAFDLAAESGCTGVFLGIESGDNTILKAMNKGATVDKYRYGIKKLNECGIITYASFIIGFPGETEATAWNTINFINDAQPAFYCLETYFHDPKVPIAEKTELVGLKGNAYSWQHNTMEWRQATALAAEGYRTITGSTILPLYSFDLWTTAYLMGQGMSRDQITRFLRTASGMLVDSLDNDHPDFTDHEERLLSVFRELETTA